MHVNEIVYETQKDENLMTNTEFWFYRGSKRVKNKHVGDAINCMK